MVGREGRGRGPCQHTRENEATEPHREALRRLLRHYTAATGSPWGRELVQDFERYVGRFWLVKPRVAELGELLAGLREAT